MTSVEQLQRDLRGLKAFCEVLAAEVEQLQRRNSLETREVALLERLREIIPPGTLLSAREVREHDDEVLRRICAKRSVRGVGRMLARLEGRGLTRVGRDDQSVIWMLN